jgi:hypothetical protein
VTDEDAPPETPVDWIDGVTMILFVVISACAVLNLLGMWGRA